MGLFGWERVERDDDYYKVCLAGSTAAGFVAGVITAGAAAPATGGTSFLVGPKSGTAIGFAAGYLACPYLAPFIRRKIEDNVPLSRAEVLPAAEALGLYAGVKDANDALRLLAMVRTQANKSESLAQCDDPVRTAHKLLGQTA